MVVTFLGVEVDNVSLKEAVAKVGDFLQEGGVHMVVTPNPEIVVAAEKDAELRKILNTAALRVPDGIGMVMMARWLGCPLKERVTGIDLLLKLTAAYGKQYKLFFLGSAPGVAEAAAENLKKDYPGIKIVGAEHGYFSDEREVIAKIKAIQPDMLFVGLGGGRQEKWLGKHLKELDVPVAMVMGGSLDVISGKKQRAPRWVQRLYIEWLYRLFCEPSRWRRQLALLKFVWRVMIQQFPRGRKSASCPSTQSNSLLK